MSCDRLPDRVSVGVLTRVFPPEVVDAVLLETGRLQQRRRALPARLMVYYVLALALFADASYEEVMRQLTEGLAWSSSWRDSWVVPDKAAIARARQRLGVEPLELLFRTVAVPLSVVGTVGAFYRGWRVVSLDGSCLDVADTSANESAFGRPGSHRRAGGGAFPMVRVVGVCESGSHAIVDAELAPYRVSERVLADALVSRLTPGVVCLADRGIFGFERFNAARASGAEVLWRVMKKQSLPVVKRLRDGSFLSRLEVPDGLRATDAERLVRVVEYSLASEPAAPETAPAEPTSYRLLTSILEPKRAPAAELAALYRERWEIENAFDELKTHQRGPRAVLRSKSPEGVLQEAYGLLLTHYAIRRLMYDAALSVGIDPDRLSFTRSLRAARRSARADTGLSPQETR